MRHFHDLYAMKRCHMANGHPRRKIPKFPDGGQAFSDGGGLLAPSRIPLPPCSAAPGRGLTEVKGPCGSEQLYIGVKRPYRSEKVPCR